MNIFNLIGEFGRFLKLAACSAVVLSATACANVPKQMKVRDGIAPSFVDKDVRFRTTYYFRVFDTCSSAFGTTAQPITDSLYRFVMTGKANAFANKIKFESGTLRASQIDPFGATVEQDEATGRLRYVSEAEVQSKAQINKAIRDVEALLKLKESLKEMNEGNPDLVDRTTMRSLDVQINALIGGDLGPNEAQKSLAASLSSAQTSLSCPPGSQGRRGFQIMGPQGVKTFNQDERLLMAMSSSAKPLVAALSEVSGRYLSAKEQQRSVSDILLPLVREQLIVSRLTEAELKHDKPEDVSKLIQDAKALLQAPTPTTGEGS